MRISFASVDAFKIKAKHLASLLGLSSHGAALEVLAKLAGFKSYREVTSTLNLSEGSRTGPEAILLPRLLSLRPGLTEQGGQDILRKLGMCLTAVPTSARRAPMDCLSAALSHIVPSEISKFWHVSFSPPVRRKTTEFAAYFGLTFQEAQAVLHRYVDDGLLTYAGLEDGIEAWALSRDGVPVFAPRAKRLSKTDVEGTKTALADIASKVFSLGVMELSMGGRPVHGKTNGQLLVGVKVTHEPFVGPACEKILNALLEALSGTLDRICYTILLFKDAVPERLQKRLILQADASWSFTEATDSELDLEEEKYLSSLEKFLKSKGFHEGLAGVPSYGIFQTPGMHHQFCFYLEHEASCSRAPVRCEKSPVVPVANTSEKLAKYAGIFNFDYTLEKRRESKGHYGWPEDILAEVDYFVSTGAFDAFLQNFDPEERRWWRGYYQDLSPERLETTLMATLQAYREWVGSKRAQKEKKKAAEKPPADIRYYAVFDCLNFTKPQLVAFVRQPTSNSSSFKDLEWAWSLELRRIPKSLGYALGNAGLNSGYLSLFTRRATSDEIKAYETLCLQAGATQKYILVDNGKGTGRPSRRLVPPVDFGKLPAVLTSASLDTPVLPKLLLGAEWRSERTGKMLFDVIRQLPRAQKALASALIVDVESITMQDFAERASRQPCEDLVVLSSSLTDAWRFSLRETSWLAAIDAGQWSVQLESRGEALDIRIQIDGFTHTQQLAPYEERFGFPYKGQLSLLFAFMAKLRIVRDTGLDFWVEKVGEGKEPSSGLGRLPWFVNFIDGLLQGAWISTEFDRAMTSWPSLQVQGNEELAATDER